MNIEHNIPKGYEGKGGIRAAILAKSVNVHQPELKPIVTFLIDFPRFILPEFNTHKCLVGATKLNFDLPRGTRKSRKHSYSLSIETFHRKWVQGSTLHTTPSLKKVSLEVVEDNTIYTAKEISQLLGVSVSNIRTSCRAGRLAVENPLKKRNEDFKILGSTFKEFRLTKCVRTFPLREKLKKMFLRMYNPNTKSVEHTHVIDCWISGEKPTLKLTTTTGESITATEDHLILTDKGWKELQDITIEDSVITLKRGVEVKKEPSRLKNIGGKWTPAWNREILPKLAKAQNHQCHTCQEVKPLEVHHVIPVHVDKSRAFDLSNVIAVCKKCHRSVHHKKKEWQEGTPLQAIFTKVSSIEPAGIQVVYDVSVSSPHHNFSANNIIVHNCLEKNGASSRAIPVAKQIERVYDNPVIPIHFGKNQAGMVAESEVEADVLRMARFEWESAASSAVKAAKILDNFKIHKQVVNRLLEPFSMMRMVVTGTEWDNFFWLRLHKDADPHIAELARVMLHAYQQTKAMELNEECWHVPFFGYGYWSNYHLLEYGITAQEAINHSMSCCAQTSYRKLDMSEGKAEDIISKLFGGDRNHSSPATHQAHPICYDFGVDQPTVTHQSRNGDLWSNNLRGWGQYRTLIPNNNCTNFDFNQTIDTADIKANVDMF